MMTEQRLDKPRAELLAALIHCIRGDWGIPGIVAALAKVAGRPLYEVILAAVLAARNPQAKTPEVIAMDGDHWRDLRANTQSDAERHPSSTPVNDLCHIHNRPIGHDIDGEPCDAPSQREWRHQLYRRDQAELNAAGLARAKAALEQARATGHTEEEA